ncbi:MAG: hypothetical protein AUI04_13240 [Candidatus Rokubacteria bacterium 13_2_20CM_2_64_8]|nr:MAG: hypothetical protein AUI04_13240 [Candidatus Rokubacteria bacterium 13_2_20CM_2_64_8]
MSRRLVLSAVVAVTLLGQAVALLYEIVVAASFGTGRGADALALALGLALVIANEVGSWVPILFQPEYIEARTTAGDSQAAAFFVRTATLLTGIGAAIAVLLIVTAPGLLSLPGLLVRRRGRHRRRARQPYRPAGRAARPARRPRVVLCRVDGRAAGGDDRRAPVRDHGNYGDA